MKRRVIFLLSMMLIAALLSSAFTINAAALAAPVPKAPVGIITTTTPVFKWTPVAGAAYYKLEIYQGTTRVLAPSVPKSACTPSLCVYALLTDLDYAAHKWHLKAVAGGVSSPWSVYKNFIVTRTPINFNSQFNGSMAGWAKRGTIPWLVNATEMYTTGQSNKCTNVYWTHSQAYKNFDYTARVKRPAGTPDYNLIYLAVRMGNVMFSGYNCWAPGYLFGYLDSGYIAIWRSDPDGKFIPLYDSVYTTAIKKNDWNVLRVVANGSTFKFYINGKLQATVNDSKYKLGWVGIRTFTDGSTPSQFLVDWAKLTVLP